MSMRIDNFLSVNGYCARRKAEEFLRTNRVCLQTGEQIVEPGFRIDDTNEILINQKPVLARPALIYIALNKPENYLCSSSDHFDRPLALDLIPESKKYRLYNVGRLDFDSCGLILFTNDGKFCQQVSHPRYEIEKEYEVKLSQAVKHEQMLQMTEGIMVDNEVLKIKNYKIMHNGFGVKLTLIEGKNREIRRLFEYFGNRVKFLKRIRIGPIRLEGLASGKRRSLSENEVAAFKEKG